MDVSKIGVPPKHPKMIIFSRKTHGCLVPPFKETPIWHFRMVGFDEKKKKTTIDIRKRQAKSFKESMSQTYGYGCFQK